MVTELWVAECHHYQMSFSGAAITKFVTEATGHELFTWNFYWQIRNDALQFQDLQAVFKADIRKSFTWHTREQSRLSLLCDHGDVQYFCHVRGDAVKVLFDFYKLKNCTCFINKVLVLIFTVAIILQSSK